RLATSGEPAFRDYPAFAEHSVEPARTILHRACCSTRSMTAAMPTRSHPVHGSPTDCRAENPTRGGTRNGAMPTPLAPEVAATWETRLPLARQFQTASTVDRFHPAALDADMPG